MKRSLFFPVIIFLILLGTVVSAQTVLSLHALFSDNMVLQRDSKIPVWGKAEAGRKVDVRIGSNLKSTYADADGKWKLFLNEMSAGENYEMTVSSGKDTVKFTNVSVGEVWLCSGQSNMEFQLIKSENGEAEIKNANDTRIRLFTVAHKSSPIPLENCEGVWKACSPENVKNFSAVAYHFAKNLINEINVTIGLIHSSWGGTPIEAWISKETLESDPEFEQVFQRWEKIVEEYPAVLNDFNLNKEKLLLKWKEDSAKSVSLGFAPPRKPGLPTAPGGRNTPYGLYNGMIYPLAPYGIRGVIWYQGESNVGRPGEYKKLFPAMIKNWRDVWGVGQFPFYFVQLPNFAREPEPSGSGWPELREAQLHTLSVPNTGMAVTIDVGDPMDLHPKNKTDVGYRLALIALANAYGKKNLVFSGPIYKSHRIDENKVILDFYYGEGLTAMGDGKLKGFRIASDDWEFVDAEAVIENNKVIVWSDKITKPSALRYAWGDNPTGNLYNKGGLPASPFRTDNREK
ncbi:MAG TPA: sialate O-acetylesterase [Melioribacteraceae bacterium]|nr:sialate O-acetylesterase [Melioribacteraceae bacterium]